MDCDSIKMHIFLDTCYEAESSCAEMYHLFAQQFTADRKISSLWGKTALEEENHARHVYFARKMVKSIHWVCLESWRNASSALAMIKEFLMSVRESPPSIQSALFMALECEHRMENLHMQSAILVQDQAGNSLFRALMKDDRGHIEMLEAALEELQREQDDELEMITFELHDDLGIVELHRSESTI